MNCKDFVMLHFRKGNNRHVSKKITLLCQEPDYSPFWLTQCRALHSLSWSQPEGSRHIRLQAPSAHASAVLACNQQMEQPNAPRASTGMRQQHERK